MLGADHVVFGSDYPHPEGMVDPVSFVDELEGLPERRHRRVMGENLNRLMGLSRRLSHGRIRAGSVVASSSLLVAPLLAGARVLEGLRQPARSMQMSRHCRAGTTEERECTWTSTAHLRSSPVAPAASARPRSVAWSGLGAKVVIADLAEDKGKALAKEPRRHDGLRQDRRHERGQRPGCGRRRRLRWRRSASRSPSTAAPPVGAAR